MKRNFTLLALLLWMSLSRQTAFSQTIDGNINDAIYTTTIAKQNANNSFGANIDITSIKIGKYADSLYIGVVSKLDVSNNNAIGLLINFSNLSGAAAGTNLRTAGAGSYLNYNFDAAFEVDYLLAMNPGGTNANCYVDAAKKVGGSTFAYLDECGQSGTAITATGLGFFGLPGVEFSYLNTGTTTSGFEIKIPYAAVGLTAATAGSVQVFAFVVSGTGFFSNVTVPGNFTAAGQIGQDGAGNFVNSDPTLSPTTPFNTLAGGPYYSTSVVIPVEIVNFNANVQGKTVNLDWLTASEFGNAYFDIQRSANGRDWTSIGTVKGNGTTASKNSYKFTDDAPLSHVNYYRLKQVDFDDKFDYSAIVSVNMRTGGKGVMVYPNPVSDKLNLVSSSLDTEGSVQIFDMKGSLVRTSAISNNQLDVFDLPIGLYQLRLINRNGVTTDVTRFVKK